MKAKTQENVEREGRKSGLVGKVAKTVGKAAIFPVAGFLPNSVQKKIYQNEAMRSLSTLFSSLVEGTLGIYFMGKNYEGASFSQIPCFLAGPILGLEGFVRFIGSMDVRLTYGEPDLGTLDGYGSIEGYVPGKIIEAGMSFYDKYKSRKEKLGGSL
jgi:hypothetical protein